MTFVDRKTQLNDIFNLDEIVFYKNINDFSNKLNYYKKNDENRKTLRQEMCSGALGKKLQKLDKNIADDSDWVLGQNMGLPDIALWRLMGWLTSGMLDGIPTNLLTKYPKVSRVCSAVDVHPKIQEWVSQTYPKDYIRGNYL